MRVIKAAAIKTINQEQAQEVEMDSVAHGKLKEEADENTLLLKQPERRYPWIRSRSSPKTVEAYLNGHPDVDIYVHLGAMHFSFSGMKWYGFL